MNHEELLARIVVDPRIMVRQPTIRSTNLSIQYILGLLRRGATADEILQEYQGPVREDVQACLAFAAESLDGPRS